MGRLAFILGARSPQPFCGDEARVASQEPLEMTVGPYFDQRELSLLVVVLEPLDAVGAELPAGGDDQAVHDRRLPELHLSQ